MMLVVPFPSWRRGGAIRVGRLTGHLNPSVGNRCVGRHRISNGDATGMPVPAFEAELNSISPA
jgi:hypothetical protein